MEKTKKQISDEISAATAESMKNYSSQITEIVSRAYNDGMNEGLKLGGGITLADVSPELHPRYIEGKGIYVPIIDIVLNMKDEPKEMTWDEAKDLSLSKQQWFIILYFRDEINALLKEHGGQELEGWYWTSTQYSQNYAWNVYSGSPYCYTNFNTKYYSFSVRAFSAYHND